MGITATATTAHQVARYEISSLTNPQKRPYVVSLYDDGEWRCSCPAWIFKKGAERHDCKHIIAVRERRDKLEEVPRTQPATVAPRPPAQATKPALVVSGPAAPGTGMEAFNAGKAAAKPGYTGRRVVDYDFDLLIEEREIVAA